MNYIWFYPRWPLSKKLWSHDVKKHWAVMPDYSQRDGWGRPGAPWTASAAILEKEYVAPIHSLHSILMEMTALCTDKHTQAHTHRVVGTGQGCGLQMGRLTSENSLSKSRVSIHHWERLQMRKPGAPSKSFFSPFQGKMPRAIKKASSKWMEKADVPYSGLREVRAGGNAFRNALRDM